MSNKLLALGMTLMVALAACSRDQKKTSPLKGDGEVLALVEGREITRYDLENTIYTSYGKVAVEQLDDQARKSVLESLVQSRAIAKAREKELSVIESAALEKRVQAYRENLLVKQYLAKHAPPKPVTRKMIEAYYEAHQERYGGKKTKTYEMLFTQRSVAAGERNRLMTKLSNPEKISDWKSWVKELQKAGLPLQYRSGPVQAGLLHPKLAHMMDGLKAGETSKLSFVDGKAYIVRVQEEPDKTMRALSDVQEEIREILRRQELAQAIKKISEQILQKAEVEYR